MNANEIKRIISRDKTLRNSFIGIYASDELNFKLNRKPACLIVNTDPSYLPGQHWICMYIDRNGRLDFFDSLGLSSFAAHFKKFLTSNSLRQFYNNNRLQSSDSYVCGVYCLYFLYFRSRGFSMSSILKRFNVLNFAANDIIVCKFLYHKFHYKHFVCCLK
jgi:Adenovirus endoprotease